MSENFNPIPPDILAEQVHAKVAESHMPTEKYPSMVTTFGGKLVNDTERRLVYDTTGFMSKVDRFGDPILRTTDEHVMKEPGRMLRTHPRWFFKFIAPGSMRSRGTPEQIVENAQRLGLDDTYGPHERGIEIKRPEVYHDGVFLYDIYNAPLIDSELIKGIDRQEALATAASYIRKIHDEHGSIGEVLGTDIIFQKVENGKVSQPILDMPDIVYNPKKELTENAKKATDLLDFMAFMAISEYRRSQDDTQVSQALKTIVQNYGDPKVLNVVKSFAKRGRLTMTGDEKMLNLPNTTTTRNRSTFAAHNFARTSMMDTQNHLKSNRGFSDKESREKTHELAASVRQGIITTCEEYLTPPN